MGIDYAPQHAQGFTSEGSVTPDKLFDRNTRRRKGTILSGEGALGRGTLLGKVSDGAVTATGAADVPAPAGATITPSPAATTAAKDGVHYFQCITAGATGKWRHTDPDGEVVGDATTGTQYVGGGLTLTISDSGTDPAVGERFKVTVSVAAGSGKWRKSLAAATDGSEEPRAILLHDVDATSADVEAILARKGDFAVQGVIFGAGHTAASVDDVLIDRGIFLENIVG